MINPTLILPPKRRNFDAGDCKTLSAKGERLATEYLEKKGRLPKVDAEGRSACDDAEDFFADVEESEQKLRVCLKEIEECISSASAEIVQLRKNGDFVEHGRRSLHNPEPKAELSDAERRIRVQYNEALELRTGMEAILLRIREVLAEPAPRWPLGKPKRRPRFGPICPPTSPSPAFPPAIPPGGRHPGWNGPDNSTRGFSPRLPGELTSLASEKGGGDAFNQ